MSNDTSERTDPVKVVTRLAERENERIEQEIEEAQKLPPLKITPLTPEEIIEQQLRFRPPAT
jgi:hypothetical protein